MGLFSMLAQFDPDKVVESIEAAEQKLDRIIDTSNDVVNTIQKAPEKVEVVTNVIHKQANAVGGSPTSSDDASNSPDE